jgi:hypothetical protein
MTVAVGAEQAQESTAKTGGAKFTRWGQAKHANREERDRSQQRGKVVGSERAQAVSTMVGMAYLEAAPESAVTVSAGLKERERTLRKSPSAEAVGDDPYTSM